MVFKTSTLWHLFFLLYQIRGFIFCINLLTNDNPLLKEAKRFGPFYLSSWCALVQVVYLTLALLSNNLNCFSRNTKQKLESLKGYIFVTFVLPMTTYVTAVFWAISFLDIELVPHAVFDLIPSWLNHGYHTMGLFLVLMDLLFENNSTPNVKSALFGITMLAIVYYTIFFGIYFLTGKWLYVFFFEMSWLQIVVVFAITYLVHVGLVITGVKVQTLKSRKNIKRN